MEIEGEEGSKVTLKGASAALLFGRGRGFNTDDRSVSRKHLLLRVCDDGAAEPRVSFQVLGKNPVWVRSRSGGGIRIYRRSDGGEIGVGDRFCVSGRRPVWFNLKKIEDGGGGGSERNSECESELAESGESVDVSSIDPVKEFGFLVIGHEFDQYPKQMLRNAKHWDWFLEDPSKGRDDNGDEDEGTKAKHRGRKKRRRVEGNNGDDDEEWTGESEDEKDVLAASRKAKKPSYWTRSKKDTKVKPPKSRGNDRLSQKKRSPCSEYEDIEDEKDGVTLGGFIVDDEDDEGGQEEEEEEEEEEDEEEEEFIDDEEDE